MNWLDVFIVLFLIAAIIRGLEVGFVRQFFSTLGFFGGALFGIWLQSILIQFAKSPEAKSLLVITVVLSCGFGLMTAGEYLGMRLKFKLKESRVTERIDSIFGSALAAVTLLAVVWLGASTLRNLPFTMWQRQIAGSRVVASLNETLPSAPELLTRIGHLVDPNGFPHVFSALEPKLPTDTPLPNMGELNDVVAAARPSIVKVEGEGCGGIVVGSGFIAGPGTVVTNAHVIAGVKQPFVVDQEGQHRATVALFNPSLDIAILRSDTPKGKPLSLKPDHVSDGTAVAVAGYPGDAGFTAGPGVILEEFTAYGRDIYNKKESVRNVYSLKATVEKGNSGGPLLDKDGSVVGVLFAKSFSYDQVGYALTADQVIAALTQAKQNNTEVTTGSCAE
ncbi:MAG TPA: MarP family serine protease [Candidatus Saccharimonadales bacterium]|nr:MarP family serine protease [Candidatus Saccharimonadales bacterium]